MKVDDVFDDSEMQMVFKTDMDGVKASLGCADGGYPSAAAIEAYTQTTLREFMCNVKALESVKRDWFPVPPWCHGV
jgi:hypothetical protein